MSIEKFLKITYHGGSGKGSKLNAYLKMPSPTAIWLDHASLVNAAFKAAVPKAGECYELREELFFFHAKQQKPPEDHSDVVPNDNQPSENHITENKPDRPRVRKRKQHAPPIESSNDSDIAQFQAMAQDCLQQLKELGTFPDPQPRDEAPSDIPRYWEESHAFPKFKGANNTEQFQRFSFGLQSYLIPPRSIFFNHNATELQEILGELKTYDLIVMDPPWRNKYIRRLKRLKQELAYRMLDNAELKHMPIDRLVHVGTLVAIWCTNARQHQRAVLEDFLPSWNLSLVHTLKWLKVNTSGMPIGDLHTDGNKQPYEVLYIACHKDNQRDFTELQNTGMLLSIPSIIHSHKPPLLSWLGTLLPEEPTCLELFARYLQPRFTSIGLEVLKLMDERLYRRLEEKNGDLIS